MENKDHMNDKAVRIPENTDLNNIPIHRDVPNEQPAESQVTSTLDNESSTAYQTPMQKTILEEPIFQMLIANMKEIDFVNEISDGKVTEYQGMINRNSDKKMIAKLEDEIKKIKPTEDEKFVVLMEQLLMIAEVKDTGLISSNGGFYFYNSAYWEECKIGLFSAFLGSVAEKAGISKFTARQSRVREKLIKQFATTAAIVEPDSDGVIKINLQNGTFFINKSGDGEVGELKKAKKEDYIKYQLPFAYDKNAKAPLFEKFLSRVLPDINCQKVLLEYLGYVFTHGMKLEKTLFLHGGGSNGKSVIFEIISALLGSVNISEYSMDNLLDDTGYYRAKIGDKLLNYCTEVKSIRDMQLYKKMTSGEPIDARSPYKEPFILKKYCKFIFNANGLPDVEQTDAFFRRQIIIPFSEKISEEEKDIYLHSKIIENELSGVFNLVLEGLKRLISQGKFTESELINTQMKFYRKESNNVKLFVDDERWVTSSVKKISLKILYPQYKAYCVEFNYRALGNAKFSAALRALGYVIDRSSQGYYYVWCEQKTDENFVDITDTALIKSILKSQNTNQ